MDDTLAKLRFVGSSDGTICIGTLCGECKNNCAKYSSFGKHPYICVFDNINSCSQRKPFYFFMQKDSSSVILFSQRRIPFELPKTNFEAIKELKEDLISAISALMPLDKSILHARYGTTNLTKRFYDAENVLFYNIGTRIFHNLANYRTIFETISPSEIISIRNRWKIPEEYSHYYEYSILTKTDSHPQADLLAEWHDIPFCNGIGSKPGHTWRSIKESADKISVYGKINCDIGDTFSLKLKIEKPSNAKFFIMNAMKPLLDGVICAFHTGDFDYAEAELLSEKLACDIKMLQSSELCVLGRSKGNYIRLYRNNVKWNPADDLCQYVDISIAEGTAWKMSGKLYFLR